MNEVQTTAAAVAEAQSAQISLPGAQGDALDTIMLGAPKSAREAIQRTAIPIERLRELSKVNSLRSGLELSMGFAWLLSVPLLYFYLPGPLTMVVCIVLAIHNFNYLAQLVHESDHATLFENKTLNDIAGNICANLLCYHRRGHWQSHLFHHMYLNTERDPDQVWSRPGESGRAIAFKLLEDLLLVSAFKRFLQYFQPDDKANYQAEPWKTVSVGSLVHAASKLLTIAIAQGALLAIFSVTAGPQYYFWLHLLPLTILYPMQIRVRSIAEHGFYDGPTVRSVSDPWMTRSSRLNFIEQFVIAPMGQHHHYEHHLFPAVPNSNLPSVRRMLEEAGIQIPSHSSYLAFTSRKILKDLRRPPAAAPK